MSNKTIFNITFILLFVASVCGNVFQFRQYRSAVSEGRNNVAEIQDELSRAADANNKLRDELTRQQAALSNIGLSISSGINTIDDCVNCIHSVRQQIQALEKELDSNNSSNSDSK